jgi:hypothetical protein
MVGSIFQIEKQMPFNSKVLFTEIYSTDKITHEAKKYIEGY